MVYIDITFDYKTNNVDILVNGHANYDVKGKDIVCASISSTMNLLKLFSENRQNGANDDIELESGLTHAKFYNVGDEEDAILFAVRDYFEILAKQYPSNVTTKVIELNKNE